MNDPENVSDDGDDESAISSTLLTFIFSNKGNAPIDIDGSFIDFRHC